MLRFEASDEFVTDAAEALAALAERPGYLRGQLARAYDDPRVWCMVTEWESVGAYRRALGCYDVKLRATAVLSRAVAQPSAFEPLATAEPGAAVQVRASDRAENLDGSIPSRP